MKKILFIFALVFAFTTLKAQDYRIESLVQTTEMAARENIKLDFKDRQCAVFRIATQNITPEMREGFRFESDYGSSVADRQLVGGEIWLWVSPGIKTLKIYHDRLGNIELHTASYGVNVQSLFTYKIVIKGTMAPAAPGQPEITQQFLVFKVEPKDALVTVNGAPWPVVGGVAQKRVDFGQYSYRIEAQDYHPEEGTITVNDAEAKVVVEKNLRPAFGFLKIEGDNSILSQASIHIDNANGADALTAPRQLPSGQHRVRIIHPRFKPYEQTVTITDGQTNTLRVNLNTNFSNVTLTVEADAEIWVNGEMKGVRSWTGDLEAGSYTFECRMTNHKPSIKQTVITENMSGQTISLEVPTPIIGVLAVSTTPIANLYIDGELVGETPVQTNIIVGQHNLVMKQDGFRPMTKTVTVVEGQTVEVDEYLEPVASPVSQGPQQEPRPRTPKPEKNYTGITFATVNFAFDPAPQTSFGLCFGSVKKWGWFVSAMSNFGFKATKYDAVADADGSVEGEYPIYSGESCSTRLSLMGGALIRLAEPLSLRVGVGYGMRAKSWYTTDNTLINIAEDSWKGVDLSLGAQLQLKGFVVSLDAVTTSFKSTEIKLGVGYGW